MLPEKKKVNTHIFDGEVQHLSHEGRQFRHEGLVAVVLSHVRQHDGPEWRRTEDLAPRDWWRLSKECENFRTVSYKMY